MLKIQRLINLDCQSQYILLKEMSNSIPNFFARNTTLPFFETWCKTIEEATQNMIHQYQLTPLQKAILTQKIKKNGLGIIDYSRIQIYARGAALLSIIHQSNLNKQPFQFSSLLDFQIATECLKLLEIDRDYTGSIFSPTNVTSLVLKNKNNIQRKLCLQYFTKLETTINQLKDEYCTPNDASRLFDLADNETYKVLSLLPTQEEFKFTSEEFRIILRTRLLINETLKYQKCYDCWERFPNHTNTQTFCHKANHPDGCKCQNMDSLRHTAIKRIIRHMIAKHVTCYQGKPLTNVLNEPDMLAMEQYIAIQKEITIAELQEQKKKFEEQVKSQTQHQNHIQSSPNVGSSSNGKCPNKYQ